jgi:glycosyltransferase involved in cell wall biosynthesis
MIEPTISVLMPAFNTEAYLSACLDSIRAQDFPHWELLVVDDFSTDKSREIMDRFAAKDPRIQVFSNREKGIIPALRLAYQHSKGRYITRMDSDDQMPPHKLGVMARELDKYGEGHLITGKVKYFSDEPLGNGYKRYEVWLNRLVDDNQHYADIYRECVVPSPCWMVSRADLERCGAFRSDRYPEDYDLVFRFYRAALQIRGVDQVLHYWRDRPDRASRTDPTYADNAYLKLKVPYFLELDYDAERPLVLWGAGPRGKRIAKLLQAAGSPFYWICNTPSKWGQKNGGITYHKVDLLNELEKPQVIIAVGAPEDQDTILAELESRNWKRGRDFFFFC